MILSLIYGNHNRGGDAGVGYGYAIFMAISAFVVCMAIVTVIIGVKGGFSWVGSAAGMRRFLFVLVGFGLSMWGIFFFLEGGVGTLPKAVGYVLKCLPLVAILSVLTGAMLLLNEPMRANLPGQLWRLPVYLSLCIGLVPVGFSVCRKISYRLAVEANIPAAREAEIQSRIALIDSTDLIKNGVFLYNSTDGNQEKEVRERALERIKSRPDWQEELIRRLQNDWAEEAFKFLASNEVDDKTMFAEPVRQGVLIQAKLIRENIKQCRDAHSLYAGKFSWEVERVLKTVDKFEGMGVDYRPAVQEMRNALDQRTSFEKPKLAAKGMLDKWLKKH